VLTNIKDFVCPTLITLESLGGRAWLSDIKEQFHRKFANQLDSSKDWKEIMGNHGEKRWEDYCGSRVYWQCLKPNGYVNVERHGKKGSIWELTNLGRMKVASCRKV
jgi:hypothetical protein